MDTPYHVHAARKSKFYKLIIGAYCVYAIFTLSLLGIAIYVISHFVSKYW